MGTNKKLSKESLKELVYIIIIRNIINIALPIIAFCSYLL